MIPYSHTMRPFKYFVLVLLTLMAAIDVMIYLMMGQTPELNLTPIYLINVVVVLLVAALVYLVLEHEHDIVHHQTKQRFRTRANL